MSAGWLKFFDDGGEACRFHPRDAIGHWKGIDPQTGFVAWQLWRFNTKPANCFVAEDNSRNDGVEPLRHQYPMYKLLDLGHAMLWLSVREHAVGCATAAVEELGQEAYIDVGKEEFHPTGLTKARLSRSTIARVLRKLDKPSGRRAGKRRKAKEPKTGPRARLHQDGKKVEVFVPRGDCWQWVEKTLTKLRFKVARVLTEAWPKKLPGPELDERVGINDARSVMKNMAKKDPDRNYVWEFAGDNQSGGYSVRAIS